RIPEEAAEHPPCYARAEPAVQVSNLERAPDAQSSLRARDGAGTLIGRPAVRGRRPAARRSLLRPRRIAAGDLPRASSSREDDGRVRAWNDRSTARRLGRQRLIEESRLIDSGRVFEVLMGGGGAGRGELSRVEEV